MILGLDRNLLDLDPHLHFPMELLLYLDLAPRLCFRRCFNWFRVKYHSGN
jgi:hypothetical protein